MCVAIGVTGAAGYPHLTIAHRDLGGRYVVGPGIECPAGGEIEAGVMPVAGEDAVGDRAAMQREAQVRAAIVESEHAVAVPDHQDRAAFALDHDHSLRPQLVEARDAHEALVAVGGD